MSQRLALLERIASLGNLRAAWKAVRERRGGPGIDRVSVAGYAADAEQRLDRLSQGLLDGSYRPSPVMRFYPKSDPKRPLSIPTVQDRIAQRAVAAQLTPILEPTFSDAAWAYRPRRSVDGARLLRLPQGPHGWRLKLEVLDDASRRDQSRSED